MTFERHYYQTKIQIHSKVYCMKITSNELYRSLQKMQILNDHGLHYTYVILNLENYSLICLKLNCICTFEVSSLLDPNLQLIVEH